MYFMRGMSQLESRNAAEALKDFNRVLRDRPMYLPALTYRSAAMLELGQYKEALADAEAVVESDPLNARGILHMSIANMKLCNLEDALAGIKQALKIDDSLELAYYNRGLIYRDLGQHKNALVEFEKANAIFEKQAASAAPGSLALHRIRNKLYVSHMCRSSIWRSLEARRKPPRHTKKRNRSKERPIKSSVFIICFGAKHERQHNIFLELFHVNCFLSRRLPHAQHPLESTLHEPWRYFELRLDTGRSILNAAGKTGALVNSTLRVELASFVRAANGVDGQIRCNIAQLVGERPQRLLASAQYYSVDIEDAAFALCRYVQTLVVDFVVRDTADGVHAHILNAGAVNPSRGSTKALARLALFPLEHVDLSLGVRFQVVVARGIS